jgi:hypothetical protein
MEGASFRFVEFNVAEHFPAESPPYALVKRNSVKPNFWA